MEGLFCSMKHYCLMLHNMEQRFYITFQTCWYKEEDRKANKYIFNTMLIYKRTKNQCLFHWLSQTNKSLWKYLKFSVKCTIIMHILWYNNSLGKNCFIIISKYVIIYHNFKCFCSHFLNFNPSCLQTILWL